MAIDVDHELGALDRSLSARERSGASAHVIVVTRVYDAPRAELWDALTNAERIRRWFLPVTGELRQGGRFQLQGNAGGEIVACEAPTRLQLTWEMQGQVSWVTVELSEDAGGRTALRLEHEAHVPDEFWVQFGPGAVGVGWDLTLFGLDQHFSTGASVDPASAAAWMASDEGRTFVQGSSDAWCEASVTAGTDPESARAAASRTTAFYTGG